MPSDELCARGSSFRVALALIMLVELMRDLSRPVNKADSDEVGSDLRLILALEGDLDTKNFFSQRRNSSSDESQ